MPALIDITGQRFGRLTAVSEAGVHVSPNGCRKTTWLCRCECGAEVTVRGNDLRNGDTKSCGCLNRERSADRTKKRNTSHGLSHSPLHRVWCGMMRRCYSLDSKDYPNYGGRGIKVCDRWRHSFPNFLADMGERPEGLSLDREDNDGDYTPSNCRWATRSEQRRNQRPRRAA